MMANEEHFEMVKQGVQAWNEWRRETPPLRPDLSDISLNNVDLTGIRLAGVDLRRADLRAATLREANLSNAILREAKLQNSDMHGSRLNGADLVETELSGANLTRSSLIGANLAMANLYMTRAENADLRGAMFTGTRMGGASFRGSDFRSAVFRGADLSSASLEKCVLGWTALVNMDLSNVEGLETVVHWGPSSIGIDTIYRSRGRVAEVFLRGAGIPEGFIAYAQSLVGQPIQLYSCFISHSSKDQAIAGRLYDDLRARSVRCWFAPEDMRTGDLIRARVDESIELFDKLLLVLSEHSLASAWVAGEVEAALERERKQREMVLFPITLDDAVWDSHEAWAGKVRRERHIGDFRQWKDHDAYQVAFERLLRDLKAEGG